MGPSHGWSLYWTIWFFVMLAAFLGPEIYALATNWRNTLSNWVWHLEDLQPGQPLAGWTAVHVLFAGAFLVLFGWLAGHLILGIWR